MLFDQFDKKLKDAADHHHPNYDEKAWLKMEKLLDKHMPVDKDRRRILFLVLFAFLGLGGAGLLILKPWKETAAVAVESSKQPVKSIPAETINEPSKEPANEPVSLSNSPTPVSGEDRKAFISTPYSRSMADIKATTKKPADKAPAEQNSNTTPITKNNPPTETGQEKPGLNGIFPGNPKKTGDVFSLKPETTDKKEEPDKQEITKEPAFTKNKKKNQHALFLSLTAGPDLIFVKDNVGSVRPFAGAGLGYTFNNRVSLRTGIYVGRKVYSANPDAYNPPAIFYTYYPYLEKVDANCKIYEIPVSLSYHFGKSQDRKLFVSAGLSSFIMKEETYRYHYKTTPTGPTLNRSYTIKDVNRHRFAELTLSGGYTKSLTRHISVTAEPYVKLPLKGVGYGKVKLNSAGLAVSVNVNPFAKKPK